MYLCAMLPNKEVRLPTPRAAQTALPRDITTEFTEAAASELIDPFLQTGQLELIISSLS